MNVIFLHSVEVQASRDLLTALGVAIPGGDDVTVQSGENSVRVISDHNTAVGVCPNFGGYPTVLTTGSDGKQYALEFPTSWDAIWAWAANPIPAAPAAPTTLGPIVSKYVFDTRLVKQAEGVAILKAVAADTTMQLAFAKQVYDHAEDVDLADANLKNYLNALVTAQVLTADRVTQILAGQPVQ